MLSRNRDEDIVWFILKDIKLKKDNAFGNMEIEVKIRRNVPLAKGCKVTGGHNLARTCRDICYKLCELLGTLNETISSQALYL